MQVVRRVDSGVAFVQGGFDVLKTMGDVLESPGEGRRNLNKIRKGGRRFWEHGSVLRTDGRRKK